MEFIESKYNSVTKEGKEVLKNQGVTGKHIWNLWNLK